MCILPIAIAIWRPLRPSLLGGRYTRRPSARPTDAAAISQFDAAIAKYIALRQRLRNEVPGPTARVDRDQAHAGAGDALGAAASGSRARGAARRPVRRAGGDRRQTTGRRRGAAREPWPVLGGIDDEEPTGLTTPSIHLRFPAAIADGDDAAVAAGGAAGASEGAGIPHHRQLSWCCAMSMRR